MTGCFTVTITFQYSAVTRTRKPSGVSTSKRILSLFAMLYFISQFTLPFPLQIRSCNLRKYHSFIADLGRVPEGREGSLPRRHPDILDLSRLVQELVTFALLAGHPITGQTVACPCALHVRGGFVLDVVTAFRRAEVPD